MIDVVKTKQFIKQEAKYLRKLTPDQERQYHDRMEMFAQSENPAHMRLKTHPLKWALKWRHSFTCCDIWWRSDRIIFEIKEGWPDYYEVELVEFQAVGSHEIYS